MDATTVSLGSIIDGAEIHYTLDGSEPTDESPVFNQPFSIENTTTIKAMAIKEGFPSSNILTVEFFKIPIGREIQINTSYANQTRKKY